MFVMLYIKKRIMVFNKRLCIIFLILEKFVCINDSFHIKEAD